MKSSSTASYDQLEVGNLSVVLFTDATMLLGIGMEQLVRRIRLGMQLGQPLMRPTTYANPESLALNASGTALTER